MFFGVFSGGDLLRLRLGGVGICLCFVLIRFAAVFGVFDGREYITRALFRGPSSSLAAKLVCFFRLFCKIKMHTRDKKLVRVSDASRAH